MKPTKDEKIPTQQSKNDIMQFILTNGFNHAKLDIIEGIAVLITHNLQSAIPNMQSHYAEITPVGGNPETFRVRLSYYITNNYENVRKCILGKYGYDIGENYAGVKYFIDQMTIVYSVFARAS